jgi:ATPase family associated with various cellular activities (AAA)
MKKTPTFKPASILEHIEFITNKARGSSLTDDFINAIQESTKAVGEFLGCLPIEALYFSVICSLNFRTQYVDIEDLSDFFEVHPISILRQTEVFSNLIKLGLLRKDIGERKRRRRCPDRMSTIKLYIPRDVFKAVVDGVKPEVTHKTTKLTAFDFLGIVSDLVEERDNEIISYSEMMEEINQLCVDNPELDLIKHLGQLNLEADDLIILLYVLSEYVTYEPSVDLVRTIRGIFDDANTQMEIRRSFIQGKHELIRRNLIKLSDGNFKSDKTIELTDNAIDLLVPEKELFVKKESRQVNLILPDEIDERKLYFSPELTKNVDFLYEALKPARFREISSRLIDNGLKGACTILLYGRAAGTGKTELIKQIAKATNRPLKMVVISELRSYWYGQSEKILKQLMNDYRNSVQDSEVSSILLFNECNFSTRKTNGNTSTDSTETNIINILLQEFEDLHPNSIVCCTTNICEALDASFSRRFLMKLHFDAPSTEAKLHIWQDRIPTLTEKEASELADKFSLTGGEIDNICKKYHINQILYGDYPGLDELERYCREESLIKNTERKRIGFIK